MKKEWSRSESSEDKPRQYYTPCGHLTPTQPRHEDMRMDSTLNMTLEGSLSNILTATGGNVNLTEAQRMLEAPECEVVSNQPPMTLPDRTEGTLCTSVKVISERTPDGQMTRHTDIPRRVKQMREVSQEDALASVRNFFASGNG